MWVVYSEEVIDYTSVLVRCRRKLGKDKQSRQTDDADELLKLVINETETQSRLGNVMDRNQGYSGLYKSDHTSRARTGYRTV